MMFDDIEEELDRECRSCNKHDLCAKHECIVYRILGIITDNRERTHLINIDEFFNENNKNQISIFDYLESQ